MKPFAFLACGVLLGVTLLFAVGAAQLPVVWDDFGKAANLNGVQATRQITTAPAHDLVLVLRATPSTDLSAPPSALDGAPALPLPPR
jgi:hypothetical protein